MTNIIIGHLIGDYFLQNSYIALNKSKNTLKGYLVCLLHCIIYTLSIVLVTQVFNIWFILIVFINHFIIDKFSLGNYYIKFIRGRVLSKKDKRINDMTLFDLYNIIFSVIIYIIIDNGFHIIINYYALKYFGG